MCFSLQTPPTIRRNGHGINYGTLPAMLESPTRDDYPNIVDDSHVSSYTMPHQRASSVSQSPTRASAASYRDASYQQHSVSSPCSRDTSPVKSLPRGTLPPTARSSFQAPSRRNRVFSSFGKGFLKIRNSGKWSTSAPNLGDSMLPCRMPCVGV